MHAVTYTGDFVLLFPANSYKKVKSFTINIGTIRAETDRKRNIKD
jgi:hypothetical protein